MTTTVRRRKRIRNTKKKIMMGMSRVQSRRKVKAGLDTLIRQEDRFFIYKTGKAAR